MYIPTVGCRIIHFNTKQDGIPVECWDTSGDLKYERCWSAFLQGNDEPFLVGNASNNNLGAYDKDNITDAIIFVYNPENPTHFSEIQTWLEHFAISSRKASIGTPKPSNINKNRPHCMLLEHRRIFSDPKKIINSGDSLNNLPKTVLDECIAIHTTYFSNLEDVLKKFDNFIKVVANAHML